MTASKTAKPSKTPMATAQSPVFGLVSGQPAHLEMILAIAADEPARALAMLDQGMDPLEPLSVETRPQFYRLREKSALTWALETPSPRVAQALIERAGEAFKHAPDPEIERSLLRHLHTAATRGDLAACEAMERSGWPKPPTLLAASMLLSLFQSRGKRYRPWIARDPDPQAPRVSHADTFEPIVEWIIRLNDDCSLPLGQLPLSSLPLSPSSTHQQTTLLMIAGSARVAQALIDRGVDMTAADRRGRSALGCALSNGNQGWIETLARAGAPLDACLGSMHVGEAAKELRRDIAGQWAIAAAREGLESAVPAASAAPETRSKPRL